MNDFTIVIDTTILKEMSDELDRRGVGRRFCFDAIKHRGKKPKSSKKLAKYNQDIYTPMCCVCNTTIPVQDYYPEERYFNLDATYIYPIEDGVALLMCGQACTDVFELNPMAYSISRITIEDLYAAQ